MQHPSERLGKIISRVDDTRNVFHHKVLLLNPFLDGKVLNVDMTRTGRGSGFVNHRKRSLVVDV